MHVRFLGKNQDYQAVLALQEACAAELLLAQKEARHEKGTLFLLEHAPIYTLGRTRDKTSLQSPTPLPHPVVEIHRGGQATYHGPGQLVAYPILDLHHYKKDIHWYVTLLEKALLETCAHYGLAARLREGLVGLWVENRKIASLGVGLSHWITQHGIALNITEESLAAFQSITPCGLVGVEMTCLHREIQRQPEAQSEQPPLALPSTEEVASIFSDFLLAELEKELASKRD